MFMKKALAALLGTALLAAAAVPAVSALEPHGTGIKMRNWLTNDPNYDFSEEYKTSVWYENFTSLEFSENQRNTVLRIAVSQLGYHEGDSAADFDGMNMSGSSNYIEYARLLVPHYNNNHYEWCACFVNWCLNQAHIDYASSEIGCWKWVGELKAMKMWQDSAAHKGNYIPKPADMIFFQWEGKNTNSNHIGYVLYTTDTHVYTIEGNADNNVTIRSYALNDPCVIGYGTPPYDEGNEPTIDFSYAEGRPRGYYVVNSMRAYMSETPGGKRTTQVPVGSCVELRGVDGDYAKVIYGDKEGYLAANLLVLMTPVAGTDTVTFDANGGQDAPEALELDVGAEGTLPMATPTLEGDTFLGWALRPYDMAPVYLPGDKITTSGDVTLYAIWKQHSMTLAEAAMAEGIFVRFPRPVSTQNSGAVIMSSVSPTLMIPVQGTEISVVDDETYGQVMSLVTAGAGNDPYVTIPYAAIMKSAQLAPKTAAEVKYLVLRLNNLSLSNRAMDIYFTCEGSDATTDETQVHAVSAMADKDPGWQFVVFDMSEVEGWQGEIRKLRFDFERAALAEGETLLLEGLYLLATDEELAALTEEDLYFFPAEEKLPEEPETEEVTETPTEAPTEAPTEEITEPATEPATEAVTEAVTETTTEAPTEPVTEAAATETPVDTEVASEIIVTAPVDSEVTTGDTDGGCSSAITASVLGALAVALAVITKRRKNDE